VHPNHFRRFGVPVRIRQAQRIEVGAGGGGKVRRGRVSRKEVSLFRGLLFAGRGVFAFNGGRFVLSQPDREMTRVS